MDFKVEVVECDPMCTVEQQISEFWKIWKRGTTIFVVEQGTLKDLGYISWLFKLRGKNKFACIPYIREDSVYNNPYFCYPLFMIRFTAYNSISPVYLF